MRFYQPGDEIYMFGFSRGSYIARFLAEMIDHVGLLSHGNEEMVKFAWKAFAQWQRRPQTETGTDEEKEKAKEETARLYNFMKGFRETFSRPVGRIRFLGLFDTVNSVPSFETAWMQRSKFPYTARSTARVIRHAVSIDERRAKFRQDLMYQQKPKHSKHEEHTRRHRLMDPHQWKHPRRGRGGQTGMDETEERGRTPDQKFLSPNVPEMETTRYRIPSASQRRNRSRLRGRLNDAASDSYSVCDHEAEEDDSQDIDEVWFSGGHGDVGGGWEILEDRKSASHVPLAWIVREAIRAGLSFDPEKVAEMGCACSVDWDHGNPSRLPADVKKEKKRNQKKRQEFLSHVQVPAIRMNSGTEPDITEPEYATPTSEPDQYVDSQRSDDDAHNHEESSDDEVETLFHKIMGGAHTALIHDSLCFKTGGPFGTVATWKFMEWLPFRRMDLQADGTWKPIRWPLPRGETRDIPDNVRVHGSVISRMKADPSYRPGNLIIGGGGRGVRKAPAHHGIGDWECVSEEGDPIGEIWARKGEMPCEKRMQESGQDEKEKGAETRE